MTFEEWVIEFYGDGVEFFTDVQFAWEAATKAEREACAKICDRQAQLQMDTGADDCCITEAKRCARDIRMRSVKEIRDQA